MQKLKPALPSAQVGGSGSCLVPGEDYTSFLSSLMQEEVSRVHGISFTWQQKSLTKHSFLAGKDKISCVRVSARGTKCSLQLKIWKAAPSCGSSVWVEASDILGQLLQLMVRSVPSANMQELFEILELLTCWNFKNLNLHIARNLIINMQQNLHEMKNWILVSKVSYIIRKNWFSILNELITGLNEDTSKIKFLIPLKEWTIY